MKKKKKLHCGRSSCKEKEKKLRERDSKAAQIAMVSIKRRIDFSDGLQVERDLISIIYAPNRL
ncbi:hypothetical protein R3W88_032283 [Solanum pinnatisectum]|uniref:Uncharacterized protein n=1 Tax=Solanum pinnatisectum TaxID=50273 RepID=A0AAV9LNR1_9SOLN|nr:hypothetical protein R3W88_032283 [Solanum pinnatisectum]